MDAQALIDSLDRVAERSADPAPEVYARLFARHPEMEALFVRDTQGAVRGQMLAQAVETLLDFAGARTFAPNMLRSEVHNHADMGVPPEVFPAFYLAMSEAFAETLGEDWTPAMQDAWSAFTAEVSRLVAAEAARF
ncbi:globin [Phenylobacterium sp.]|uniref:globin n=1 Tax=Phenylobacterium sp. TaxID=1871053 RepID=UPI002FD9D5F0